MTITWQHQLAMDATPLAALLDRMDGVQIQVSGHWVAQLRMMYEETSCPRTRLRVQMVLLSYSGYSVEEIAKIIRKRVAPQEFFSMDSCLSLKLFQNAFKQLLIQ